MKITKERFVKVSVGCLIGLIIGGICLNYQARNHANTAPYVSAVMEGLLFVQEGLRPAHPEQIVNYKVTGEVRQILFSVPSTIPIKVSTLKKGECAKPAFDSPDWRALSVEGLPESVMDRIVEEMKGTDRACKQAGRLLYLVLAPRVEAVGQNKEL